MDATDGAARVVRDWLARALALIVAHEQELGQLDAVAGDGDHGATMVRGLRAAVAAVDAAAGSAGQLLMIAGDAFADAAGGAAGALVGALLSTTGRALGSGPYDPAAVAAALQAGLVRVMRLGKAQPGDKTLIDALHPFIAALAAAPERPLAEAWRAAMPAAVAGAEATRGLVARRGRSAALGERSRGHPDAGAVSLTYLLQAMAGALDETCT
jgi:dihydroxyacetone kinase